MVINVEAGCAAQGAKRHYFNIALWHRLIKENDVCG